NIDAQLETQAESEESLTTRRLTALEALYRQSTLQASLAEIRLMNTPTPEVADDSLATEGQLAAPGQLDTLAYIANLRDRLIAAEDISESELATLGSARRDAVIEFLSISGGISADRLIEIEPTVSDEDEAGWLKLPFGLTTQ
ncbi:MAG: hypothetical protein JKY29_05705, partial [Gammaproteobacteria bacterium]|nr:hypothetical protein [Gammaproteobacteria bacterium]